MRGWRAALRSALAVIGMTVIAGSAAAQSSTSGDIQGVVRDPSGAPVAGATVVANGPQGARATTTGANGSYLIEFLNPGTYDVTATAQGYQPVTQRGVAVRLGTRVTLPMQLAPMAEAEETITITAAAPTVDTSSTSIDTNIGSDLIGSIPTGRTFSGLVTLAPGVVDGGALGNGNPSISGSSGLENQYVVNGVNITNTGYGSVGSYSLTYGSLGTGVNFDFIDAVQVKSAGFEAEYGQALGGIIAVTTKRGTNEFHGSIFSNWQPGGLESPRRQRFLSTGAAIIGQHESMDVGVTIGGPLVKDKAFFFAAVNPQSESQVFRAPNDPLNYPLYALGSETRRRVRTSYAGTLTWNVMDNHTLDLSLFGDPGVSEYGPQLSSSVLQQSTLGYSRLNFGGHNQILRYTGVFGSFMSAEAIVANASNIFEESFPSNSDTAFFRDFRQSPSVRGGGVGFYEKNQESKNTQYSLKLTNYVDAVGRHEIKYGVTYEDVMFSNTSLYSGPSGTTFYDENGDLQTIQTGVPYYILTADDGTTVYRVLRGDISDPAVKTTTSYTAFFLQDKWSPIPTLTVDLGVRIEEQRLVGGGPGSTGYTFHYLDNLAPRLGAAWDFTGKGRGKVFAAYGRYVEKIPNDLAVRLLSNEFGVSRVDYFAPPHSGGIFDAENQIPDGTVPVGGSTEHVATQGGHPTEVYPGTKSQYQDEITFGAEYEPVETINVGLRYIHREIGRVLEDFATSTADDIYAGTADFGFYVLGNPGSHLNNANVDIDGDGVADIVGCPPAYPNCWVDPSRVYDALELTVEKRLTTNWQLLGSYRLARLYGNYEGLFRNDNGQSDPNLTSLFDFPNNTPFMEGQGKKGPLPTDRTHVLKVAGSYMTAFGLNVGANFQYFTGTPITRLANHPVYENTGEVPVGPGHTWESPVSGRRGNAGRSPSNYTIDVHADYALPIRSGMDLRFIVDVFNLLDTQETATVNQYVEQAVGVPDPDFRRATSYQAPRQVRLGMRLAF